MPHLVLTLDILPPANPTLLLDGGRAVTGSRIVLATLGSDDVNGGAEDVDEMKIWGDVDETSDADIQILESDSTWIPFVPEVSLLVSDVSGRKRIYAKLRDTVGNTTQQFTAYIDLDLTLPVVTISTGLDVDRISKVVGSDEAVFTWESNKDAAEWEIRVVPSETSPHTAGVALGTLGGSINVSGAALDLGDPVTTTVNGSDLERASPGSTTKIIKVFCRTDDDIWSV